MLVVVVVTMMALGRERVDCRRKKNEAYVRRRERKSLFKIVTRTRT